MSIFQQLEHKLEAGGISAALQEAAEHLRRENRYHELFEVLKMESRNKLGLPLLHDANKQLTEQQQRQLEDDLLESCRTIGFALLEDGQIQDSWVYLRHLQENNVVLQKLKQVEPTDENLDQLIGLMLYEGLDCEAGYQLVLQHYGTCNAITTMQQALYNRDKSDRQAAGRLLVRHVHDELLDNVKGHIEREESQQPSATRLTQLMENRDFLFAEGAYHIDTSHLSSTVQVAGELTDKDSIELALDMARYGEKLDPSLQYSGDPPFEEVYSTYIKFFEAQLGQNVEAATAYFQQRAESTDAHQEGTFAIETYVDLLSRLGQHEAAIETTIKLIPAGIQTTGRGPTLYDLSEQLGDFQQYRQWCTQQNDVLGFVISLAK